MLRPAAAFALLLAAAPAHAGLFSGLRGNGQKTTERREVSGFREIRLEGSLDLEVEVGVPASAAVTIDSNLQSAVELRVEGQTLVISIRDASYRGVGKVAVGLPALEALSVEGSGDASVGGQAGGDLRVSIAGSGDVRWRGTAGSLRVRIQGSGNVDLSGKAALLDVEVAGSGDVQARALSAGSARVRVAGSGDVDLTLDGGTLDAEVAGSGDVRWSGQGQVVRSSVAGSGGITRR